MNTQRSRSRTGDKGCPCDTCYRSLTKRTLRTREGRAWRKEAVSW